MVQHRLKAFGIRYFELSTTRVSRHVGITDLPFELIEHIGYQTCNPDLLHLRPVNKQIAAGIERPMLPRHFSELWTVLAIPSSLRRALRVARHEGLPPPAPLWSMENDDE
jgi:hypothetical protein